MAPNMDQNHAKGEKKGYTEVREEGKCATFFEGTTWFMRVRIPIGLRKHEPQTQAHKGKKSWGLFGRKSGELAT